MTAGTDGRLDARAKATGELRYAADLPVPGALHAALVRSTMPHARIRGIDAADARAYPGVSSVLTADDLPPALAGRRVRDMPLLARDVVRFVGEPVAAVLADTRGAAEAAAALVYVDYEDLPAVTDACSALDGSAPLVHDAPWGYPGAVVDPATGRNLQSVVEEGDLAAVEAALASAAHVVSATYRTPAGHQGYLEPQTWVAFPPDDGGQVRLWGTTKSPYRLRDQIAACLSLPKEVLSVDPSPLGGDFGGKGGVVDGSLCVALALAAGRPVRLALRSSEDITATDARHPSVITVRVGCDGEGRLVGLHFDAVFDGGAYAAAKPIPSVNLHGALDPALGYRIPVYAQRSRIAYTNNTPKGHMRAPGAPQSVFAMESALGELAEAAGLDPAELRRRNLLRTGEPDAYGHHWPEARGEATLDAALEAAGQRQVTVPDGWLAGTGIAVYARATPSPGETSLRLSELPDGRLELGVPIPETGTGSHTVARGQLAAALGVAADRVVVRQLGTRELPRDPGVGASRVTSGITGAIAQLAEAWAAREADGPMTVEVAGSSEPGALSYCAQVAWVGVDPETGAVRLSELLNAVDVASIVRPTAHRMQVEGGTVMGLGFALLEDLGLDEGQAWSANLGEFKLPAAGDVPELRTVLVEGGRGVGPANVKAIGELTNVPVAAAVAAAVFDATGVRVRELPVTAERVYRALRDGGRS